MAQMSIHPLYLLYLVDGHIVMLQPDTAATGQEPDTAGHFSIQGLTQRDSLNQRPISLTSQPNVDVF